ncbi:MAG: hypothetical protein KDA81_04495 [Planctomycetaceae bacterium]|nr:hypothetical protein [Planctomycetaceae bacterium]
MKQHRRKRLVLMLIATVGWTVVMTVTLVRSDISTGAKWLITLGALAGQVGVVGLMLTTSGTQRLRSFLRRLHLSGDHTTGETDSDWIAQQTELLRIQADRLTERERELTRRLSQFQEFFEYPSPIADFPSSSTEQSRLSEADRRVQLILEEEAERVYEKLRRNGYYVNGVIDLPSIREELLDLIRRVAREYSPNSAQPLLETSFEQLARSASRICLQTLVLLEQLPLDVQRYNINEMFRYLRHATQSYGAYQKAAPWLKNLSRGAWLGKLAASTNPVSLGVWWLASEVGRRGAEKVVGDMIDRQAVAMLHDLVAIVGAEVSNVYGPGFRQRNPSWVYGTELIEMLSRFPLSRDSLRFGLQEVSSLPLSSEYDRIYLYRCLASHRSSGMTLRDPSLLSREEREVIASRLEKFFETHVHGVTDKSEAAWRSDVEARLDMKLKIIRPSGDRKSRDSVSDAVASLYTFLHSVAATSPDSAIERIPATLLFQSVPSQQQDELLKKCRTDFADAEFRPPDLEPGSETTSQFLAAIVECSLPDGTCEAHVEQLIVETICYFRRTRPEAEQQVLQHRKLCLRKKCDERVSLKNIGLVAARALTEVVADGEHIAFLTPDVPNLTSEDTDTARIARTFVAISQSDTGMLRAVLIDQDNGEVVWQSDENTTVRRVKGIVIDDCEVVGGVWSPSVSPAPIRLPGSLSGGGFQRTFGILQSLGTSD